MNINLRFNFAWSYFSCDRSLFRIPSITASVCVQRFPRQSQLLQRLYGQKVTMFISARVAQWIRRRSPKPKIGGSSPPVGNLPFDFLCSL